MAQLIHFIHNIEYIVHTIVVLVSLFPNLHNWSRGIARIMVDFFKSAGYLRAVTFLFKNRALKWGNTRGKRWLTGGPQLPLRLLSNLSLNRSLVFAEKTGFSGISWVTVFWGKLSAKTGNDSGSMPGGGGGNIGGLSLRGEATVPPRLIMTFQQHGFKLSTFLGNFPPILFAMFQRLSVSNMREFYVHFFHFITSKHHHHRRIWNHINDAWINQSTT